MIRSIIRKSPMGWILHVVIAALVIIGLFLLIYPIYNKADIDANKKDFRDEDRFKGHLQALSEKYESMREQRQSIGSELGSIADMPESEQCFVNFYSLGCRFTGYLGPFEEGYFDPQNAVKLACDAGCRTFVLEIDYIDECEGEQQQYYPQIVVRDVHGRLRIKANSNEPLCKSAQKDNIREVCQAIEQYAFTVSPDPIVIVLYFVRKPPGCYTSSTVLKYYSRVAQALSPFQNRLITNVLEGGSFFRQKQEGRLLINKITDYNNKVLIFSNANTSGFRENNIYKPMEDLDFLVNLRLNYEQTQLGCTENLSQGNYGILQTVQDFLIVPKDREEEVMESTKLRWTICLEKDPSKTIEQDDYNKITDTFGVNCIPIQIFSGVHDKKEKNSGFFSDLTDRFDKIKDKEETDVKKLKGKETKEEREKREEKEKKETARERRRREREREKAEGEGFVFKKGYFNNFSYIPKPKPLRYIKPPIVIPGEPNPTTDAKHGNLRSPTVGPASGSM